MAFLERPDLKDERRPLLRDPVWHNNYRYGKSRRYGNDTEAEDELLGLDNPRNQKFQWMLFLGVTFISILILLGTLGVLIKLSETHPSPPVGPTSTPVPFHTSPSSGSIATSTHTISTTITTSTTPSPPFSPSIDPA